MDTPGFYISYKRILTDTLVLVARDRIVPKSKGLIWMCRHPFKFLDFKRRQFNRRYELCYKLEQHRVDTEYRQFISDVGSGRLQSSIDSIHHQVVYEQYVLRWENMDGTWSLVKMDGTVIAYGRDRENAGDAAANALWHHTKND